MLSVFGGSAGGGAVVPMSTGAAGDGSLAAGTASVETAVMDIFAEGAASFGCVYVSGTGTALSAFKMGAVVGGGATLCTGVAGTSASGVTGAAGAGVGNTGEGAAGAAVGTVGAVGAMGVVGVVGVVANVAGAAAGLLVWAAFKKPS